MICSANQFTDFYNMGTLVVNELNLHVYLFTLTHSFPIKFTFNKNQSQATNFNCW